MEKIFLWAQREENKSRGEDYTDESQQTDLSEGIEVRAETGTWKETCEWTGCVTKGNADHKPQAQEWSRARAQHERSGWEKELMLDCVQDLKGAVRTSVHFVNENYNENYLLMTYFSRQKQDYNE